MPIGDWFSKADYALLGEIMRAGAHATVPGALRSALWLYGTHFERQGLLVMPPRAFALSPADVRKIARQMV